VDLWQKAIGGRWPIMQKHKNGSWISNRKGKFVIILFPILMASLYLLLYQSSSAFAQQLVIQGSWTDKEKNYTYSFLKDNEFRFRQRLNWSNEKKKTEDNPRETEGIWRYGEDICWAGPSKGNLMIYVDTMQCCMQAGIIGGKLVLTEIWRKEFCDFNICSNRLLNRVKSKGEK
jgi:hypothetical protein